MSRYDNEDEDDPSAAALWEANYRRALLSPRGQQVLRTMRDALYALPERRLIISAVCTVGGADIRTPLMTDAEAVEAAESAAPEAFNAAWWATLSPLQRATEHAYIEALVEDCGEGVCAVGAYAWHQLVLDGNDPDIAFLMLPTFGVDCATGKAWNADTEGLFRTAALGKQHGIVATLGWELAYRNDMTYQHLNSRERWVAFVEWINTTTGDHPYPELLGTEVS